jgi:NAD(P)-dependent dehydrogenase (short-subunit alcohol dehydrogenase family)
MWWLCGDPGSGGWRSVLLMPLSDAASAVWFVTGSSSGFGRALVEALALKGRRVAAAARDPDSLSVLAGIYPDTLLPLALDVTVAGQVTAATNEALAHFGRVDVIVNNAGCGLVGALEELSEEQLRLNVETNFFGPLKVLRALLPALRGQRSGHIVNISAAAAIANYPGFSIYGAAKCALEGASEALAAELKPLGIGVTIVQPGPFRTDFVARSLHRATDSIADYDRSSGQFAKLISGMNGKQPGDPAKAAEAIITAVESAAPPLRLVLGRYAIDKVKKKVAATLKELEAWEKLGADTAF